MSDIGVASLFCCAFSISSEISIVSLSELVSLSAYAKGAATNKKKASNKAINFVLFFNITNPPSFIYMSK